MSAVNQADTEGQQQAPGKPAKRLPKKFIVLISVLLVLLIAGSVSSVVGAAHYRDDMALAQTGITHLRRAESLITTLQRNPFDAQTVSQAQREFAAASSAFGQVNADVSLIPGIGASLPVYGSRVGAAQRLVPIAAEISQAGVIACNTLNLLIARLHNPTSSQGQGLTEADFNVIKQNFQQLSADFNLIIEQVSQLQPADLQFDPHLSSQLATFQRDLPQIQTWLDGAGQLLFAAPALLGIGAPANYLIEILDSTELRPGGGFIGNYGIATLSGGRLVSAHITDVNLLDRPFEASGKSIPFPPAYTWFNLYPNWSFRDSNLDADFPTDARNGEMTYTEEGGKGQLQGVIALTPALIQNALLITGPIAVPEYNETITAQNLIERIHFHQLGPHAGSDLIPSSDGLSSQRKHFTALLAEHFLARVRQFAPSQQARLLQLLVSSVRTKDLQIYLNASGAERFLQSVHLDAAIQPFAGDSLFVVDANIAADKANSFITNTIEDQVSIDEQGNAIHHTTIKYVWATQGPVYGSALYRDYVRVYVPPGSSLQAQSGWEPRGSSTAFGREVWAGFFKLAYGQTRIVTLTWTLPNAAKQDAQGWHYRYLIQRQAGAQRKLYLQVTLPACATIGATQGGLLTPTKQTATLIQTLNEDVQTGIDYRCSAH
jgi:hypothetical protein